MPESGQPWPAALAKYLNQSADTNPYATAATLRAWDLLLRNAVADGLEAAAGRWRAFAQQAQKAMAMPTREHPRHDPDALQEARRLREIAGELSELAALVRAQPVPPSDRVWNRLRRHQSLLDTLLTYDARLALAADQLAALAAEGPLATEPERRTRLLAIVGDLRHWLQERQRSLNPPLP